MEIDLLCPTRKKIDISILFFIFSSDIRQKEDLVVFLPTEQKFTAAALMPKRSF